MFLVRVGLQEIIVCAVLFLGLILIPVLLYWKTQRMSKDK
jgi:hypothetical protein